MKLTVKSAIQCFGLTQAYYFITMCDLSRENVP